MITKEAYRRNEEAFSALLLDGIKEFGKGEQVVLSKEVAGAEGFPLICVTIEKTGKRYCRIQWVETESPSLRSD